MENNNTSLRCAACEKNFSSQGHLQRHQRILHHHYDGASIPCPFCHKPFARIDVMRRHTLRCPSRAQRAVPKALQRGPRKASCVRCSRMKVACDKGNPCSRCESSHVSCGYINLTSTISVEKPYLPDRDLRSSQTSHADASSLGINIKTSIPFLLSYSDPKASFDDLMKATNSRPVAYLQRENTAPAIPDSQSFLGSGVDLSTWSFLQGICGLFDFPENPDPSFESEPLWDSRDQYQLDAVQVRIDEVLHILELYRSRTKPQALNKPCPVIPKIRSTLKLSQLDTLIRVYLDYAALHVPLIYRSYFNIHTISRPLFLAILASGGQLLPSVGSTFSSPEFFELVQDYIFDQAPLRNPHCDGFNNYPLCDETVELLQAALIMLSTEVATRSSPVSHSTCISRFLKLVAAIRGLSLVKVQRCNPFTGDKYDCGSSTSFSSTYKSFLRDEAMIRIAWMAFLLDTQFVLFFRTPPRFTITEMIGDLPCPDELFTKMPEPELDRELQSQMEALFRSTHGSPTLSLSALIDLLMQPSWSDDSRCSKLNARGLFCGICGLHSMIFLMQTTNSVQYMRHVLERALDRWRILWDELQNRPDKEQNEMLGFMKHALEFWVLAKTLLRADPGLLKVEDVDMPSKGHLYDAIKRIGGVSLASEE